MSRFNTVKAGVALAALAGALVVCGCGLITAGVSVPEAFTHNGDLGLKGTIQDDQGAPVDDVLVTVKREYYLWHADGSYSEFDTMTVQANHAFEIPARRAHALDFTFHKIGYEEQSITVGQKAIQADYQWIQGNQWPLNTPVQIILQKADRRPRPLRWLALDVDFTDPATNPVIDLSKALPPSEDPSFGASRDRTLELSKGALAVLPAGRPAPAGSLYASVERQPTKASGPDHRVDPLDLNLPARFVLHLADASAGAGFVSFVPAAGTNPLAQMTQAPEQGYAADFPITGQRLRQLRDPSSDVVPDRNAFFYFHANGVYGKAVLSWSSTCAGDENGPFRLFLALIIQPDGTRNLAMRNMP